MRLLLLVGREELINLGFGLRACERDLCLDRGYGGHLRLEQSVVFRRLHHGAVERLLRLTKAADRRFERRSLFRDQRAYLRLLRVGEAELSVETFKRESTAAGPAELSASAWLLIE